MPVMSLGPEAEGRQAPEETMTAATGKGREQTPRDRRQRPVASLLGFCTLSVCFFLRSGFFLR